MSAALLCYAKQCIRCDFCSIILLRVLEQGMKPSETGDMVSSFCCAACGEGEGRGEAEEKGGR